MIPLAKPWIDDAEIAGATAVLQSGMLVMGQQVARFEAGLAERTGRRHAIAVANGTAALELALEVLAMEIGGIGPGDEVLVPALTWPSPAHAVLRRGANVRLVDIGDDWNGAPEAFAAARSEATKAAIVIDQFGNPIRRKALKDALGGLPIIEDAACGLGSLHEDGRPVGSFGRISCMSFHPRKVITTGEGGVCLTDDDNLAHRLRALRNHGQQGPGDFLGAGPNERLTDLAGALGNAQLARLDAIVEGRRRHWLAMKAALEGTALTFPTEIGQSNAQTFGALLPGGMERDAFIARCREEGVGAGLLSYSIGKLGSVNVEDPTPNADVVANRGVALPLYPTMSDEDATKVAEVVRRSLR